MGFDGMLLLSCKSKKIIRYVQIFLCWIKLSAKGHVIVIVIKHKNDDHTFKILERKQAMKKVMLTMVAVLMMSATAMAQDNNGPRQRRHMDKAEMVKMQTERMVKDYGLDEAQQAKLLELNTQFAGKLQMGGPRGPRGPRGGQGGQRGGQRVDGQTGATQQANGQQGERPNREQMEARMKEMKANREAYNGELKKIMTTDQFAKYEAAEKQRMERRSQRQNRNQP